MRHTHGLYRPADVIFVVALLHGCAPSPEPTADQSRFNDPFAYCAAVGTVDSPDARYTGAKMPASIIRAMKRQGIVSADTPREFADNAVWRCMNGDVLVCHFGANLPCLDKADTSRTPTPAMAEFCRANPTADVIPAAVTGRATVYQWDCVEGKAMASKTLFTPDARGYLSQFWYVLKQK